MSFFRAATRDNDANQARRLWDELFPLCEFICAKSHIRVAHTGLDIAGRPAGAPRRPMRMLGEDDREKLESILSLSELGGGTTGSPAELSIQRNHALQGERHENAIALFVVRDALPRFGGQSANHTLTLGVLEDNSGLYADATGAGSTLAAQMAVEDSGLRRKAGKST